MSKWTPERRRLAAKISTVVAALGCLFVGAWQISPAAAWITVGAVIWIDLTIGTFKS